jgi:hypothetical protein|tara:strand:- start:1003 stop:1365 length:363 start_codon:yes stop_codon:yes gene_type:complete
MKSKGSSYERWLQRQFDEDLGRIAMGPERRIAFSVIIQAIKDCSSRRMVDVPRLHTHGRRVVGKPKMQQVRYRDDGKRTGRDPEDARRFLEGSQMLKFWCSVIGMSHQNITNLYKERLIK